jgi:hypothetical protein
MRPGDPIPRQPQFGLEPARGRKQAMSRPLEPPVLGGPQGPAVRASRQENDAG